MKRLAFLLIIASVIIGGASFQSADSLIKVEAKALLESTPSPVEVDNIPPVDAVQCSGTVEEVDEFGTKSYPTWYEWECGYCYYAHLGGDCPRDEYGGYWYRTCYKNVCNDFGGYVECERVRPWEIYQPCSCSGGLPPL